VERDGGVSAVAYLVRHGEVEHHRSDLSLTPRGREQAHAAGLATAHESRRPHAIHVFHSPVLRAAETAHVLYHGLALAFEPDESPAAKVLYPPQPDPALHNVRFILTPGSQPQEPSRLFAHLSAPAYLATLPPARAAFYRAFWSSADPMGYWLTHDSDGATESPEAVLARVRARLHNILSKAGVRRDVYIMVTHSAPMRVLLRAALGTDPGEPNFCEIIALELSHDPNCAVLSYRGWSAQITWH
jgi:broad specificity phosphatase PhoE